jgi:hypothetical protein
MYWIAAKGFDNGNAISLGWAEQHEADLYGLHGYPTAAQAKANPNTVNAISRPQVEAWFANAEGVSPTHTIKNIAKSAAKAAVNAVAPSTASTNACLINIPVAGCVLTKTQGRAMIAGLIIGASGLVGLIGVMLIVAEGFRKTGAAHAAGGALETAGAATAFVPGLEGAGIALGATGAAARRAGSSSGASQSIQRRQGERESRRVAAAKAAGTTAKGQTP